MNKPEIENNTYIVKSEKIVAIEGLNREKEMLSGVFTDSKGISFERANVIQRRLREIDAEIRGILN